MEKKLKAMNEKNIPETSNLYANSEYAVDDTSKSRIVLPIGILKNGHRLDLRPVNLSKGDQMTLSNTCSFDAIVQILCSTYCDSDVLKKNFHENENFEICELIITMIKYGITAKTYKHRANILSKCLDIRQISQDFYTINCKSTIVEMYKNIWGQHFKCGMETWECK